MDNKKLIKSIKDIEKECSKFNNGEAADGVIVTIEDICLNAINGDYPVVDELDTIANNIVKILKNNSDNFPKLEMLLTNEAMKIQTISENLGKFYIA